MNSINRSRRFGALLFVLFPLAYWLSISKGDTQNPAAEAPPRRTAWTTSRLVGSLEPPSPYRAEPAFGQLRFHQPVVLTRAPGTTRLFLAELQGRIYSFENDPAVKSADLFFDLRAAVPAMRRLYGMTFHPDFERNRYCYVCYVRDEGLPDGTRVSRFTVVETDGVPEIDASTETIIFSWSAGGHNAGCLKFGPDGMLYLSTGDGAEAFPPDSLGAGQNIADVRAAVLRIDVDHPDAGKRYAIPPDNPFVDHDNARGEIWAYGFRNPWKISFDAATGELWVGDVGWEMWELVYRVRRGGNYGWSLVEGPQPVNTERERGPTPILPAAVQHSHTEARSITGGHVYRGRRLSDLHGAYIYGDHVTGKIWALRMDGEEVLSHQELVDSSLAIICFGRDHAEELFVVDYVGGIYRLVPNEARAANRAFPTRLSETGLFASVADHVPAPGVIPYTVNAEPWADGAVTERLVALPGTSQLGVHAEDNVWSGNLKDQWSFPNNAVLAKTVSLPMRVGTAQSLRRLETQILHRDGDTWRGYTYVWNDEQTDATLAPAEGLDRSFTIEDPASSGGHRKQSWHFASRAECIICHTTRGGSIYGFTPAQLNRDTREGNQLSRLTQRGLFADPPPKDPVSLVSPYDESKPLGERARAYLHVNCAHCHRRGGGGTAAMDIRHEFPLEQTNLLNQRPTQGTFGIHAAEVVAAGDPYRSVLYYRMAKLGRGRMPYFGSAEVDERGLQLMHDWIAHLPADAAGQSDQPIEQERRIAQTAAIAELHGPSAANGRGTQGAIERLLTTTTGALKLLRSIDEGRFAAPVREEILAAATSHSEVQIRDLFERFVPHEQRTKRLGAVIKPDAILRLAGDAGRGRRLFLQTEALACKNCHRVGGEGGEVGPDLSEIGKKYQRAQLLGTILEPSQEIDPKYVTYLAETTDGRVHTGLLVEKNAEQITLRDAQGKDVLLPADEIEILVPQRTSLMPELLLRDMTAQQVADLLEFLVSLK